MSKRRRKVMESNGGAVVSKNNRDQAAALDALARMLARGGVASTEATRSDMAALGIPMPAGIEVIDTLPAGAVLVCADADISHPMAATNRFGRCDHCSAPIMYRPHAVGATTKICVRCGAALDGQGGL